ncbi:flagellar biosynthetic protein FliO [Yersinia alsatica]|uniref:flagellar biosynthetic protein FliO n=1 Tax=Yersinia alsatica TaxID=2890317 RepID=UPI001643E118|nr:flagellar biosynthetic protein FliO [Yersinia alsatica]
MDTQTPIQTTPSMIDATTPGSLLVSVGGTLVMILLIIAAIAWLARRSGLVQRFPKGNQVLSVISSHSLGQRERLIVVEMENKRLLLGVTSTQINYLATFDKSESNDTLPDLPLPANFQSTLVGMLKKHTPGPKS